MIFTNNKAVFLDRDGVLNKDKVDYVYQIEDFHILDGVIEAIEILKKNGFVLVVITNQSGIAKGIYTEIEVEKCWQYLQQKCNFLIDDHYFAPHHPKYTTESLSRKPDSLLLEKAIAKYKIDVKNSWIVGDSNRDIEAGKKVGIKTIQILGTKASHEKPSEITDFSVNSLLEATKIICAIE
ncbi:MAG: HAD-IIIA family hydrolase [Bacteroidetes bacterium]|nr:MAG: HAD-IIIA family hydrolase [Bacteroidota bacterium]TAG90498.1 MAG: HAD-IIIA family hydrolase [Bacteroidota bacterium]